MSKIFRLHTGASENIEHWQEINGHLSDNFINTIEDPAGSTPHTQITSIPSPFARMDLVRTAFRYINSKRELEGNTIYHKIVSECFDIAEIFFNIEALQDKVELIEWNSGIIFNGGELDIEAVSDLGNLLKSTNVKHKLLGETLKMFLFQDKNSFNFASLKNIYLLNYKHGPELINIIGGTSPATLFFSSANNLSFVDINFGNDRVFDNKYCSLDKRGRDFIKFFYSLQFSFNTFSELFPDLNTYLDITFGKLDPSLKDTIRGFNAELYHNTYNAISVNSEGNNAEILGFPLKAKSYGKPPSGDDNDFVIEASKPVNGLMPLALPTDPFNEPLKYSGATWQKHYHEAVPHFDSRPINERTLPNQAHIKYPYLTVSDLLEPYLIKLPFPIDNEKFFDGNYEVKHGERDHCFALPIKKRFFEYFTIADLHNNVADGKKRFEIVQMSGGVKVILRLPIKNNKYVQLSRVYTINQFHDRLQQADEKANHGIILENQFTLTVYPFLKLKQDINPHYRILFVDRDIQPINKHYDYTVKFFQQDNPLQSLSSVVKRTRSSKQQAQGVTTNYYILESEFDFTEISNGDATGLLIPLFPVLPISSKRMKFAVDFGTTNTHIEYKIEGGDPQPFDITEKDIQVATLHVPDERTEAFLANPKLVLGAIRLVTIIKSEFLPFTIGGNNQYKFPQRTIIQDNGRFNPDESSYALADFNIPFWYLKENYQYDNEITPNLKWADFKSNNKLERRTTGFLKQLFIMIRNKVLLNGGDIASTQLIWFYPTSMPVYRRSFLQRSWQKYYNRYFPGANKLSSLSESLAPFEYFKAKGGVNALDRPVTCIDIGGGTTDVVVYKNNAPIILTSFKFASNSLFGDGYGNTAATNGFILRFEKIIKDSLSNTTAGGPLKEIFDSLKRNNSKSLELIEFFFSLEDNKLIKDNRLPIAFSKLLAEDTELKIVLLLYYSAIIYHIAKLMKVEALQVPRHITFSGNGSKIIPIIAGGNDLQNITTFTKLIFSDVYNDTDTQALELKLYANPKEITCKGGLECENYEKYDGVEDSIKKVLLGTSDDLVTPDSSVTYKDLANKKLIDSVCSEVSLFIDKFFGWNSKFNYYNYFGINPRQFENYKNHIKEDLKTYLLAGIEEKLLDANDNTNIDIEETLFFYPITGMLNKLAYKIQTEIKK